MGSPQKLQAPPVQHEVRIQGGSAQPQPTLTISRSQSPLPPVDWKTYTPPGRRLRPPPSCSPRPRDRWGTGGGSSGDTAVPQRSRETSATPTRRLSPARDVASRSSVTQTGQDLHQVPIRQWKGRGFPGAPRGGTPSPSCIPGEMAIQRSWVTDPAFQKVSAPEVAPKEPLVLSVLPVSSNLSKPFTLKQSLPAPGKPSQGQAQGVITSQLEGPGFVQSFSPMKGASRMSICSGPSHPLTAGRSPSESEGGTPAPTTETAVRVRAGERKTPQPRNGSQSLEAKSRGQDQRVGSVTGAGRGHPPRHQSERQTFTVLSTDKGQEALSQSLEDEILMDIRVLEARGAHPGADPCPPEAPAVQIPRSGVYVPHPGTRWPVPGAPYDSVLRELALEPPALIKVDPGGWGVPTVRAPELDTAQSKCDSEGKGSLEENGVGRKEDPGVRDTKVKRAPPLGQQGGQSQTPLPEAKSNEVPRPVPSSDLEKSKVPTGKGRRMLKKPERIPSIYKLKLRPKIRPRRDHRPEKRPSRIPTPLAYRQSRAKGPPTTPKLRGGLGSAGDGGSGDEEEISTGLSTESLGSPPAGPSWLPQEEEESWV